MKTGPEVHGAVSARAVEQVEAGRSIRAVAKSLEMSPKTLANWLYRSRKGQALVKREPSAAMTDVQAELSRLRAENARLKLERDFVCPRLLAKIERGSLRSVQELGSATGPRPKTRQD